MRSWLAPCIEANEYTVTSEYEDLYSEIDKVIQMLPENIMSVMVEKRTRELEEMGSPLPNEKGEGLLNGSYVIGMRFAAISETSANRSSGAIIALRR